MRRRIFFIQLIYISVIFQCIFPLQKSFAVPPGEMWFTLATKNFRVHHTASQENFSKAFANALEYFLPYLTKDLSWEPPLPIDIIVNDNSDLSNGYAMSFPTTRLEVFPVPYNQESSLMDYYNWVEELAIHELTHIIANDSATGFYRPLAAIFGTAIRPNGLQPGWIVEGLAVWEETRLSAMGRGRSVLLEALLRAAVLENKMGSRDYLSLDRLNDGVFWWPEGNTRYLLGYAIQASLESKKNQIKKYPKYSNKEQTMPGLVSIANSHSFPYAIHDNLQDFMGFDWEEEWVSLIEKIKKRYEKNSSAAQLELSTQLSQNYCQLTDAGKFTGGTVMNDEGDIFFSAETPKLGRFIARLEKDSPCIDTSSDALEFKPEILVDDIKRNSPVKLALSPHGGNLIYSMLTKAKGGKDFFDLYIYSLSRKKSKRLTFAARAQDPVFLDEENILFIQNRGDSLQSIQKLNLRTNSQQTIFLSKPFERISAPTVFQKNIFFSLHNNRGQEEIMQLLSNGTLHAVIPNFGKGNMFAERHPIYDSNGNLYFSATYNYETPPSDGLRAEIYRWRKGDAAPEKITDTNSGFSIWPAISQDKKNLVVSTYTINGFNLFRYPIEKKKNLHSARSTASSTSNDLQSYLTGENYNPLPITKLNIPPVEGNISEYNLFSSPATSLWPQYWIPLFETVTDGSLVGAATSGNDPLLYHNYSLKAYYDTRAHFPTYSVLYSNTSYPWSFTINAEQENNYFSSSGSSNRYNLYSVQTATRFFGAKFALGLAYQERRLGSIHRENPFAYNSISYGRPETSNSLAIAPNKGFSVTNYFAYYPGKQNEINFIDERPSFSLFSPGILSSHSLKLSANLAISTNRYLASSYFLGGGPVVGVSNSTNYIVRGYPEDTLFGKKIFTTNTSYTFPLSHVYRGWNIYPIFIRNFGFRILGDAGTSQYIAQYNSSVFSHYAAYKFGKKFIGGVGGELLTNTTLFYYIPTELVIGVHHGLQKNAGGETRFYMAINANLFQGY